LLTPEIKRISEESFDNEGKEFCTFPKCPCYDGLECPLPRKK
jgi:hypothetical protein